MHIAKRSAAEVILFAGFFLAISTQTISHQDALSRFEAGVEDTDRWQVHLVAREVAGDNGESRRYAALVGPGIDDATSVRVDPTVTGSVGAAINRAAKSDVLVTREPPPRYVAGALDVDEPFARTQSLPANLRMAFIPIARSGDTKAGDGEDSLPYGVTAIAYAPEDDRDGVNEPFEAVMGKSGNMGVVLDPDIAATHAWLNYAIPDNARSDKEITCLAHAIYFEARSEPESGRIAVAQVVLNRLKNPAYPNTICSVVYQNKHKRNRCQFSFACDGLPERVSEKKAWAAALALARRVLDDDRTLYREDVGAATHYHATYVRPRWARRMEKMVKIGRHVFYKTYKGGWS